MSDEEEIFREDDEDTEMEKGSSDLDFVRERLEDESGGMEAYRQALDAVQDPQLKEILQAIQTDEQKHQAALEQWMQEHGEGEDEGPEEEAPVEEEPEDLPEEEEEPLDKEDDIFPEEEEETSGDDASDLIDDIREVLAEHEAEAEPGEESLDKEDDEEDEDEDLPEFLKSDEEEEDEEEDKGSPVAKFMPIVKIDNEQHKAYCVVAEPGIFDLQGDRSSAEEIEKSAHRFMEKLQKQCCPGVGFNHEAPIDAYVIENVITQQDGIRLGNQTLRKGTWYQGHKIEDDHIWKKIKSGEITGLSRQGHGTRTPIGKGVVGTVRVSKSGKVHKAERFELTDEEIDRVDWVHKGANGARVAIIKFDKKFKKGVDMITTKPARADKAGARALVSKAELLDIVQKAVEPIRKENEELRSILRKKEYEQIAKSDFSGLGTPEEGAEILKSLEALPTEARKTILKTLKQASVMKAEAGKLLYHPMGSDRPAPGTSMAEFEALVTKHESLIQKSGSGPTDPKVRHALAVAAATRENGALAKSVLAEERAGTVRAQMGVI